MWFLETNTLLLIAGVVILIGLMRVIIQIFNVNIPIKQIMPVIEAGIIFYIDNKLALFYGAYILITWVLTGVIRRAQHFRKAVFPVCCLLACTPFLINRLPSLGFDGLNIFIIIGISYNMLKVVDAYYVSYYAKIKINLLDYINYMLFLPVFTSGPIFKYSEFMKTLNNPLRIEPVLIAESIKRLIRGLFKKLVLAELALLMFQKLQLQDSCWYVSWAMIIMSYFILWLDLSGYSDIAIAFGNMAGFKVPENFKKPLKSATMTQFWRNWHVTLSDYIREHIYVVLAKKKLNKIKSGLIAFLTMFIMGLWHGFTWNFIISGCYLGLILFIENLFSITTVNHKKVNKAYFYFRCFITNFLFAVNTLIFTLSGPSEILGVLKGFLIFN